MSKLLGFVFTLIAIALGEATMYVGHVSDTGFLGANVALFAALAFVAFLTAI